MKNSKSVLVVAATLSLLAAACKINKDTNCLNPKAGCYNKDTEAPRIVTTTPDSQPTSSTPTTVSSRTDITIYFSEPMKNAGELGSYKNPTGGGNTLQITGVTKIEDTTYRLNIGAGSVGAGSVTFDVSLLTDLSGNPISPGYFTITTGLVGANPAFVSSTGFTQTNITWSNPTPDQMTYAIKKGVDCSGATLTGTNVTGTVNTNQSIITTLGFAQITLNATEAVRVCLTPVSSGTSTNFSVNVTREETVPTLNTLTAGVYARPYNVVITCTDTNFDKTAYTTDGVTMPDFDASGNISPGTIYPGAPGYSLLVGLTKLTYRCIDRAGNKSTMSATYNLQSGLSWGVGNWTVSGPVQPYDVWN